MTNSRSITASWRGSLKVVVSNYLSWAGPSYWNESLLSFSVRSRPRGTDHALNPTLTL